MHGQVGLFSPRNASSSRPHSSPPFLTRENRQMSKLEFFAADQPIHERRRTACKRFIWRINSLDDSTPSQLNNAIANLRGAIMTGVKIYPSDPLPDETILI